MTDAKHEAPAEGAGEVVWHIVERVANLTVAGGDPLQDAAFAKYPAIADLVAKAQSALRARSSAPEAREEALGNLLAVIHGDGGHRALEVGTKQAALEAEKIVAGLFAAPSADKLQVAAEALEKTRKLVSDASSTGFTDQDSVRALFVNNGALTRALAVLESGAK